MSTGENDVHHDERPSENDDGPRGGDNVTHQDLQNAIDVMHNATRQQRDRVTQLSEAWNDRNHRRPIVAPRLKDLEPVVFNGTMVENPDDWITRLNAYFELNEVDSDDHKLQTFKLLMRGVAAIWYASLSPPIAQDYDQTTAAFTKRFDNAANYWQIVQAIEGRRLDEHEDVDCYISEVLQLSHKAKLTEQEINNTLLRNLYTELRAYVIGQGTTGLEDLITKIRLGSTMLAMKNSRTTVAKCVARFEPSHARPQEEATVPTTRANRHADTEYNNDEQENHEQPQFAEERPGRWENRNDYQGRAGFRTDSAPPTGRRWQQPTNRPPRDLSNVECWFCHRFGHMVTDCRMKQGIDARVRGDAPKGMTPRPNQYPRSTEPRRDNNQGATQANSQDRPPRAQRDTPRDPQSSAGASWRSS